MSNFIIFFLSFKFGLYLKSKMSLSLIFKHCGPYKLMLSFTSTKSFIETKHQTVFLVLKHAANDEKSNTQYLHTYIQIHSYQMVL